MIVVVYTVIMLFLLAYITYNIKEKDEVLDELERVTLKKEACEEYITSKLGMYDKEVHQILYKYLVGSISKEETKKELNRCVEEMTKMYNLRS